MHCYFYCVSSIKTACESGILQPLSEKVKLFWGELEFRILLGAKQFFVQYNHLRVRGHTSALAL